MKRKLINWLGLTGIIALLSYTAAVVFSPLAYPGYKWMEQAVSDLSAQNAPSKMLWEQLAALYGICSVVCPTCFSIYVNEVVHKDTAPIVPPFSDRGLPVHHYELGICCRVQDVSAD